MKVFPACAPLWKLLANSGLRRGEARALRWAWIGKESLRILSTERERTKSGKWREIPLSDGAKAALATLPRHSEYVLPGMTAPSLSRECARDLAIAGLDGSIHTLRHTYISHLVRSGVPLRTVQLYADHAHITTTEAYAYLAPGQAPMQALRLAI
jgi:integrase